MDKPSGKAAQLAAEVLHELRQPLLGLKAYAQMLRDNPRDTSRIGPLLAQVERMEQIISDFTRLTSDQPAPKQLLRLSRHVRQAEQLFITGPAAAGVQLEVEVQQDGEVMGNGRLIEQLLLNLLCNARDAMAGKGRVKLLLTRHGDRPALYVADWGPGIPEEIRGSIFEPYVTGRPGGSGLGLSVCRRIAREHGAELDLAPASFLPDQPPPSTVFRVVFGVTNAQEARTKPRILVVDDEEVVRSVFTDLLIQEADVRQATTAEQGLAAIKEGHFDLILCDKNLPGLSGLDLAREARRLDPGSRVILMTGYPSLASAQQALELGVIDYLLKPFDDIREVRAMVRAALSTSRDAPPLAPGRRADIFEDNPQSASRVAEALKLLGLEPRVLSTVSDEGGAPPAAVVVSWDFGPAHGAQAVQLGRARSQGAPFVVLAEHLTMENALESIRGGAAACLPKLIVDAAALSRELARALKLG